MLETRLFTLISGWSNYSVFGSTGLKGFTEELVGENAAIANMKTYGPQISEFYTAKLSNQ